MKRCRRAFMILAVSLLLAACASISCKAQEEEDKRTLEDVLADETSTFEDAMKSLYQESEPVTALENVEEEVKNSFYDRLSAAEQYQLTILYKYELLSRAAKHEEKGYTKEQLDEVLMTYQTLTQVQKESEIGEEIQVKEQHRLWEKEAFQFMENNVGNLIYYQEEEEKHVTDFVSYAQYLQNTADFSIEDLLTELDSLETIPPDLDPEKVLEKVKRRFYEIYGIPAETESKTGPVAEPKSVKDRKFERAEKQAEKEMEAMRINAVARVGDTYYKTFDAAFAALPPGGTMYVLKDCIAGHNVTTKSFTIYPEGQNVTVTADPNLKWESAGILAVPTGVDKNISGTWTLSGNNGYTLTIDGNRKCSSGILSSLCKITINLKNGVRLRNGSANGVWNSLGTTNIYKDVLIYNNLHAGIASQGTINMYDGEIYGNATNGIRAKVVNVAGGQVHHNGSAGVQTQWADNSTAITITGGSIYSNATDGVAAYASNEVCTTNISGGKIYSNNQAGVRSQASSGTLKLSGDPNIFQNATGIINLSAATMSGGAVYENFNGGIHTSKSFTMTGGSVYGNTSEKNGGGIYNSGSLFLSGGEISSNRGTFGGGIYNIGTLGLNKTAIVNNTARAGSAVYQNGIMNVSGEAWIEENNDVYLPEVGKVITVTGPLTSKKTVALITPSAYTLGRTCVRASYNKEKGSGVYQKFNLSPHAFYLLRPGDYQSGGADTADTDVVISRAYTIHYEGNYDDDRIRVPKDGKKYWYETTTISREVPYFESIGFKGWSRKPEAASAAYQPGDALSAAYNEELVFYALWKMEVKVIYVNNGADSGTSRSEYVTLKECRENNGYEVRKNTNYTRFSRKGYSFMGWTNDEKEIGKGDVKFPESKKNIVTFEELCRISGDQQKDIVGESDIPEVKMFSMWNAIPKITANGVRTFYEGTDVTKEMLLSNIKAFDNEDGDITENVRIISIKYADRNSPDGTKHKGERTVWEKGMSSDEKLDTWFLQMEKGDSPAIHRITYAVTDSAGAEAVLEWTVKVRFNEFPVIEAADRYFTLEEAQTGKITEEEIRQYALKTGRMKASDQEDDALYPGSIQEKLKLVDFRPEEFLEFKKPGYVVLTCSVQDSMGPGGAGKETLRQFTVHILEDGEIIKPEGPKYVRFINRENYEKNAYLEAENLSAFKKESLNQNGGLQVDSRWYRNPEYKELISGLWEKGRTAEKVWNFSQGDVGKVKEYINTHGIGNSKEKNALTRFLRQFDSQNH